jgi:hypothetical protein
VLVAIDPDNFCEAHALLTSEKDIYWTDLLVCSSAS